MLDTTYLNTAHLLRRAGFGATPDEIRTASQAGLAATTDKLLHPERTPDDIQDDAMIQALASLIPEKANKQMPTQVVKLWWTYRMLLSRNPLTEKMTLFWHGHFTSNLAGRGEPMLQQNQLFRANALGNFRTLTLGISKDPAMLAYLNGNQNFKEHPNENYARELMELFTCGIGNYTEDDVKSAARAFSGWNLRRQDFFFNPAQHDNGVKTFLGKTGNWNGDDIVDILVAHPETAKRLCTQLFTFFAYPNPEPQVLDALVNTYYSSGYDVRTIVGQILRSQAFYSDKARNAVIKCPVQYVIGSMKMLGMAPMFQMSPAEITAQADQAGAAPDLAGNTLGAGKKNQGLKGAGQLLKNRRTGGLAMLTLAMRSMGQDILGPPSVKGWDGGEAWINSSTLMARMTFANRLTQMRYGLDDLYTNAAFSPQMSSTQAAAMVDYLAEQLGPLALPASTRQTLIEYVLSNDSGSSELQLTRPQVAANGQARRRRLAGTGAGGQMNPQMVMRNKFLGLLSLMMATPEYQVC